LVAPIKTLVSLNELLSKVNGDWATVVHRYLLGHSKT
jgi:hypothetical protein